MRFLSRLCIFWSLVLIVCGGIAAIAIHHSPEAVRQNQPMASVASQSNRQSEELPDAYALSDVVLVLNGISDQDPIPKMCSTLVAERDRVTWTDATYQYKLNQAGGVQKTLQKALPPCKSAVAEAFDEGNPARCECIALTRTSDDSGVDAWILEELRINNIRACIEGGLGESGTAVDPCDAPRAREILRDSRFFQSGALRIVERE